MISTEFVRDASGRRVPARERVVRLADLLALADEIQREAAVLTEYGYREDGRLAVHLSRRIETHAKHHASDIAGIVNGGERT